jgi:phosphoribosylformylglycinamidine synthase
VLVIPVKHGDGRYVPDVRGLRSLEDSGQIVFRYSDASGRPSVGSNPNGATDAIAGVCNEDGNVLGMMPHPEHAVDPTVGFRSGDGAAVIGALLKRAVRASIE